MSSVIENTMLVSFDIKFIRRDQKQHKNGEASLINFISKDTYLVFYSKGRGAIRADFGPMSEINFVVITI